MRIDDAKIKEPDSKLRKQHSNNRVSVYSEASRGEFYKINVDKLKPFRNQARVIFSKKKLEELANSIATYGMRQPLTVIASSAGGWYEIISGERRYRAALMLNMDTVPCIVLNEKDNAEAVSIIENIQREDLNPIELMQAYSILLKKGICKSTQEIADKVNKPKSSVIDVLNLEKLSSVTKEKILLNDISNRDFLRKLCASSPQEQSVLVEAFAEEKTNKAAQHRPEKKILNVVFDGENIEIKTHNIGILSSKNRKILQGKLIQFANLLVATATDKEFSKK